MIEKIGKVSRTQLGYEDHGILTAWVRFEFGGATQGIPMFVGGGYEDKETGLYTSSEFFGAFIANLLHAFGVDSWESVLGKTVLVLYDEEMPYGNIIGIKPLPTEKGKEFIFSDLQEFYDKKKEKS